MPSPNGARRHNANRDRQWSLTRSSRCHSSTEHCASWTSSRRRRRVSRRLDRGPRARTKFPATHYSSTESTIADTARMLDVVITRPGGAGVLEIRTVARPTPGTSEVLIHVHASALNRADLLQREGRYPAPPGWPADIPGMEIAGEVAACGPGVSLWKGGDRVFGIVGGGGNAEYITVHERTLAGIPANLSWTDAAAVPEAFITAHDALVTQAGVRASERVRIHAGGSGGGGGRGGELRRACSFGGGEAAWASPRCGSRAPRALFRSATRARGRR